MGHWTQIKGHSTRIHNGGPTLVDSVSYSLLKLSLMGMMKNLYCRDMKTLFVYFFAATRGLAPLDPRRILSLACRNRRPRAASIDTRRLRLLPRRRVLSIPLTA
jgi:hypothetical protein